MSEPLVIIGAGPAAASAARALTAGGRSVLMLDAGARDVAPAPVMNGAYPAWRDEDRDQWKALVGENFDALKPRSASPKVSVPRFAQAFGATDVQTDGFDLAALEGVGGLTVAWGAGVACFNARDMGDWPLRPEDLAAHYAAEAKIVSAAGLVDDALEADMGDALRVCPPHAPPRIAERLLTRAAKRYLGATVRIGRARNAVRTVAGPDGAACANRFACIFGCADGAIYNAADDIARQVKRAGVRVRTDFRVQRLERAGTGWSILGVDQSGAPQQLRAETVLLAAGALQSAGIVLRSLGEQRAKLRLQSTPAAAFAILDVSQVGATPEAEGNSLSAIGIAFDRGQETFYAGLFPTSGILRSHLVKRLPIARGSARLMARALSPAMMLGNVFLPSAYSDHAVTIDARGVLQVKGGYAADLQDALKFCDRELRRTFLKLGCIMAPGGVQLSAPGADAHYAGTLPHRRAPGQFETDHNGALPSMPGVFVIDGAVLPSLPAKSHTLTIMANARRIATHVLSKAETAPEGRVEAVGT